MASLFREEALAGRQEGRLGRIVLSQPRLARLWLGLAALCFGLWLAGFLLLGFARRETLPGLLLPRGGLVVLSSPTAGLIEQVVAREGDRLRTGDVVAVLSGGNVGEGGSAGRRVGQALARQQSLLELEAEQIRLQGSIELKAGAQRAEAMGARLAELKLEIELQRRRSAQAAAAEQRYAAAAGQGVISKQDMEARRAEAWDQAMRLHALERDRSELLADRAALQAEQSARPLRLRRELAAVQDRLQALLQAEARNETEHRWLVRAPRDGQLAVVDAAVGRSVVPGQSLGSLVPADAETEVVLYAPSRAAGMLRAGMAAQVRFDALPYQKFGQLAGRVAEVSRSPVPAEEAAPITGAATAGPRYRVRVQFDRPLSTLAHAEALKVGMTLEATVTLEHRRFVEWAFEPLFAAKARL